jgi:hypothetical protein
MKLFAIITKSHEPIWEVFADSVKKYGPEFELCMIDCPTGGELAAVGGERFKSIVDFKLEQVVKTITENLGDVIVWSDTDVVFVRTGISQVINEYIADVDVTGMANECTGKELNGGFLVIKCSEKTLAFWKQLKDIPKDTDFYEQDLMNKLIVKSDIKYKVLPDAFWCDHRMYEKIYHSGGKFFVWSNGKEILVPSDTMVFHATSSTYLCKANQMIWVRDLVEGKLDDAAIDYRMHLFFRHFDDCGVCKVFSCPNNYNSLKSK